MKVEKMAALANILALIPGGYCAYGTWLLLHPAASQTPSQATSGLSNVLVSLFVACGLIVLGAVLNLVAARKHKPAQLHSSVQPTQAIEAAGSSGLFGTVFDFDPREYFRTAY